MIKNNDLILAIETSCDECSVAIVTQSAVSPHTVEVLSNVVYSQSDLHAKFGGVVPEIASRNHLDMISPVLDAALKTATVARHATPSLVARHATHPGVSFKDLSAVAVTQGPGLIGALLVGVSAAKAISYALDIPLVPVNHLDGHLHSVFIESSGLPASQQLPMLVCLVSGGHTNLYLIKNIPPLKLAAEKLSESRDDAAGEVFDKTAKMLGLPYPGGIHIDRLAQNGNPAAIKFPRPMQGRTLEFSFSGLKTAALVELKKKGFEPHVFGIPDPSKLPADKYLADFCASIQEAIGQTLLNKILLGLEITGARSLAVVGGVSANSRLRALLLTQVVRAKKIPLTTPDLKYCTDNAAMIGACGFFKYRRGEMLSKDEALKLNAYSS